MIAIQNITSSTAYCQSLVLALAHGSSWLHLYHMYYITETDLIKDSSSIAMPQFAFSPQLSRGIILQRPNRFIMDVEVAGQVFLSLSLDLTQPSKPKTL